MKGWLAQAIMALDKRMREVEWEEVLVYGMLMPISIACVSVLFALLTCLIRLGFGSKIPPAIFFHTSVGWFLFGMLCYTAPWGWKKAVHWAKQPERVAETLKGGK